MQPALSLDSNNDFTEMLDEYVGASEPQRGELLHGKVISTDAGGLVVDLGLKRDGIVPRTDLERLDETDCYGRGDEVDVMVTEPRDHDENVVLSIFEARRNQDWVDAGDLLQSGKMWVGKPISDNRGGLIVPFGDLRGFVPASHLVDLPRGVSVADRRSRLQGMVGVEIGLKIIEVDPLRQRLVFSQREAQGAWRSRERERLLEELHVGQVLTGTVSGLRDFGAFIDLGGTDGLVHVSELTWRRAQHPREVVNVGDKVDVKVIRIETERQRIGLSIKELLPNPWERVGEEVETGQIIPGRVTRIASFGAFVEVLGEVEGLLHTTEIPQDWSDKIVPGLELQLKVTNVDVDRQRLGLSLHGITADDSVGDPDYQEMDGTVEINGSTMDNLAGDAETEVIPPKDDSVPDVLETALPEEDWAD